MADNYLDFSAVLPRLTDEEEHWLQAQLDTVYVYGDREYGEDDLPEDLDPADADWSGCRAYRDVPDCAEYAKEMDLCGPGFEYRFESDTEAGGWGRHLWFHSGEWGYLDGIAHLVQGFLKQFRPGECWALTYANTCSKLRVGDFGGGAIFVTADAIRYNDAHDFVEQENAAFQARETNDRGEKP